MAELFQHLLHLIRNKLYLCAYDHLDRIFSRADHAGNPCRFNLFLVHCTLVLDLESQSGNAVFQRFYIFLTAQAFQNNGSDLCVVDEKKIESDRKSVV